MDILLQLFKKEEIDKLLEIHPEIKYQSKDQIRKILKFLADQNCTNQIMRNVINTNPFLLTRDIGELEELKEKLESYEITHLEKVYDTYPFILLKNAYEIDTFFFQKMKEGIGEEEARKILEEEPYRMEE